MKGVVPATRVYFGFTAVGASLYLFGGAVNAGERADPDAEVLHTSNLRFNILGLTTYRYAAQTRLACCTQTRFNSVE